MKNNILNLTGRVDLLEQKMPSYDIKKATDEQLKKETDAFESIFMKMVLDKSIKDSNPIFGKGVGSSIYSSMYKDQLAKMSAGSLGISEMLYKQLKGTL